MIAKKKFFVSVGTHPQQFNRLLKEVDKIASSNKYKFSVQSGCSDYKMKNTVQKDYWSGEEYEKMFKEADVVVCHGGAGTIIHALELEKPVVVVSRQKEFGEHTNNHQSEIADAMEREGKVLAVKEIGELEETLAKALTFKPKKGSTRARLVKRIEEFLKETESGL